MRPMIVVHRASVSRVTPASRQARTWFELFLSEMKPLRDGGGMLLWTHHHILLVEKPRLEFAYDTDPKQSAQTRVKMLDMLATRKIPLMAYHFPWPGFGHVSKMGDGFRYHAAPMEIVTIPPKKA